MPVCPSMRATLLYCYSSNSSRLTKDLPRRRGHLHPVTRNTSACRGPELRSIKIFVLAAALLLCVRLEVCGRVAQLVEQRPFKAWVAGSNPAALTISFCRCVPNRALPAAGAFSACRPARVCWAAVHDHIAFHVRELFFMSNLDAQEPKPPSDSAAEPQESFKDLLSQYEQSHSHKAEEGSKRLEATVVTLTADSILLDIGFKTEGILP